MKNSNGPVSVTPNAQKPAAAAKLPRLEAVRLREPTERSILDHVTVLEQLFMLVTPSDVTVTVGSNMNGIRTVILHVTPVAEAENNGECVGV